ncbi:heme A synthase [Bacillus sp. AFS053548]|uniref:COX15/CtaA family protein n=1 Tax=Bacillus sp. AFS053548 TaxID=2033505 RepID=UPI000BFCFBA6|nr:heme A synthase [Bacillus sp. AFS053548]PGM54897.1 heme A synthase [Bacillus sp. AFS053548]
MLRVLKGVSLITSFILLIVLLGGALVTKTNSGLGCGRSWPLCKGQIIPDHLTIQTVIELSHRAASGLAGIFVLLLAVLAWIVIPHKRETKFLAIISCIFLIAQALIGAAAVVWGQVPAVKAIHFGISLICFAAVVMLTLLIFERDRNYQKNSFYVGKRMKLHTYGLWIYSYLVVYTGALVRHENASLACPSWPLCSKANNGFPTQVHEWIQMGHRFAAFLLFVWVIIAFVHAFKYYRNERGIYFGWFVSLILVTLQVICGAVIVITNLNIYVALTHAILISCLFAIFSFQSLVCTRSKNSNSELLQNKNIS